MVENFEFRSYQFDDMIDYIQQKINDKTFLNELKEELKHTKYKDDENGIHFVLEKMNQALFHFQMAKHYGSKLSKWFEGDDGVETLLDKIKD